MERISINPQQTALSPRLAEIARLTAEDRTAKDIALITGLTPQTVEQYRKRAYKAFGVGSAAGLVGAAFREGVLVLRLMVLVLLIATQFGAHSDLRRPVRRPGRSSQIQLQMRIRQEA